MQVDTKTLRTMLSTDLIDALIRVGVIAFLVVMCVQIFSPFMGLMLWALILAVSLYPLHQRFMQRTAGKSGLAATGLVLAGLLLIGTPTVILGVSLADHLHQLYLNSPRGAVHIKQPAPSIAEWPVVGKQVYTIWSSAADNLPATLEKLRPQLTELSQKALSLAAGTMGSVFMFLGALIISGIIMAYGESGSQAVGRISSRLSGPAKGPKLQQLTTATIRSVALGVIGVAFIQALLLGVGFVFAEVPRAGILALVVMVLGILQLPAMVISLPVIAYIWWAGDLSTTWCVVWTIYLLVAGMADNVLKPLLLGRGVDAPMPVILLGALGGMVSAGIVGLFVGAVLLAVSYQLFMEWVDQAGNTVPQDEAGDASP